MKNIHILPTEKPSRLHFTEFFEELVFTPKYEKLDGVNIYITSDEEIKDSYVINTKKNKIYFENWYSSTSFVKKIILTTDADLIKDGVQAIDDEFLQWFVKNPSCEEVFLTNDFEQVNQDNPILRGSTNVVHKYKIIIPKEEPKKNWYCAKCESYVSSESVTIEETHQTCNTGIIIEELKQETLNLKQNTHYVDFSNPNADKISSASTTIIKQETLEEVAERYSANELSQLGFINCAKWQEQKTIEEVFEWLTTNNYLTDLKETLIEQFKNL